MDQIIDGIPVIDAGVNIRTNGDGEVIVISSRFVPGAGVSRNPALSLDSVKARLLEDLVAGGLAVKGSITLSEAGSLAYWTDEGKLEKPVLVWMLQANYSTADGEDESVTIAVDSTTGEVRRLTREMFEMNRTVWTLNQNMNWNGARVLLWNEGSPNSNDAVAFAAYNNVGAPRDLWATVGWNYETLNLVMHWGQKDNARFATGTGTGTPFLFFGDYVGGQIDAVAHEYGHGVFVNRAPAQPTAWLDEWFELNEFFADLSAVLTDLNERGGQEHLDTWHIAKLTVNGVSQPIRDLSFPTNPLTYNAVQQSYRDWYPTRSNCCNQSSKAHRNMTIYGHALYLMKHGGTHSRAGQRWSSYWPWASGTIPSITIQPIDTQTLKLIFVEALKNMRFYNFKMNALTLKMFTADAAAALGGPFLQLNVENAWAAVGIGHSCTQPPPTPDPQINPWYCKGKYDVNWVTQPGVTYHGQVVPQHFSWDVFGQTVADGQVNSCQPNVPETARFRMRACNGCGCSNWTVDHWFTYYSPCL